MDGTIATTITDALAAGALAGASNVAGEAVKDAYSALRSVVVGLSGRKAAIAALEEDPRSASQRQAVTEVISATGLATNPEVRDLTHVLLRVLEGLPSKEARAMGLDIDGLRAANVRFRDVVAQGTAIRIRDTEVRGDFDVSGVVAGAGQTTVKN